MEWLGLIVAAMLVGFLVSVVELFRRVVSLRACFALTAETVIGLARDLKASNQIIATLADRVVAAEKHAAAALQTCMAFNVHLEGAEVSLVELLDLRDALRKVAARNRDLLKQPVA